MAKFYFFAIFQCLSDDRFNYPTTPVIIFIRNIPPNSTTSELQQYVAAVVKRNLFFRAGKILKCEILVLQDIRTRALEFHGLVHLDSDWAGRRAIHKLKGKRFKNKLVVVKEYTVRSWHNDRRLHQVKVSDAITEKRITDRRRAKGAEFLQNTSKIFSSSAEFSRKLI